MSTPRTRYGVAPPGFRLPQGTRIGAVDLQVSDLRRSVDFYEQVLGLRVVARDGTTASLSAVADENLLVRLREKSGIRPVPRRGTFGLYHFAILLPDRPALGRFVTHLAALGLRAGAADHLVSEALYLTDPDGLGIEVYADRPVETWRVSGQELAMTTDPLDLRALSEAGSGQPWTGAPAGTRIGHMHLHVGDLDQARRFYHEALGFDVTVWSYPGALFFAADGYHHHLGTNTWSPGPAAAEDQARLLNWELRLPSTADAETAGSSLAVAGYEVASRGDAWTARDPWGTQLTIRAQ